MTRSIPRLLVLVLALMGWTQGSHAWGQVTTLRLPEVSGEVGTRIATDLVMENAPGVTGVTLDITYNPTLVTPDTDITMGPFGNSLLNVHGANVVGTDTLRVIVAVGDQTGYVGSGTLLTIDWDLLSAGITTLGFARALLEDNQSPPALPTNPVNGSITATGGGSSNCPCPSGEPRVKIGDAQGRVNDRVSVDVDLQVAATDIDAFALTLSYDTSILSFVPGSSTCTELTEGWLVCDATETTPGTINIGGLNTTPIPMNSTGTIARLSFDVVCASCADGQVSELTVTELLDDLQGMLSCCGQFTYGEFCEQNGDVNDDGVLSPGDAQCAFEMFFNNQQVTPECDGAGNCETRAADVNCDGQVTPGDALSIFARWLSGGVPELCFGGRPAPGGAGTVGVGRGAGAGVAAGALVSGPLFHLDEAALGLPDVAEVRVPLLMRDLRGEVAVGVRMDFDPGLLTFVALDASSGVGAEWEALRAVEVGPGQLLLGGFDAGGSRAGDSRAGGSRAGDSRAGDSRAGGSRAGGSRDGDSRDGDSRAGGSRDGDSDDGDSDDARAGGSQAAQADRRRAWRQVGELVFQKHRGEPASLSNVQWIERRLAASADGRRGDAAVPAPRLGLVGPHPNPFRTTTHAVLDVGGAASHARAAVYSVEGRLVRVLVDDRLAPGVHNIAWDRHATDGRRVRAGIYFLRLDAGGESTTRKLAVFD